jgi:hypothetical protein
MAELFFLLVVLLFGFASGYGVREYISRRRRRRYRQREARRAYSLPKLLQSGRSGVAEPGISSAR